MHDFRGIFSRVRKQPLCVVSLLWEHGRADIRSVKNLHKTGRCSDIGQYMVSQYLVENTEDRRLDGKKAYFFAGVLDKPETLRDEVQIDAIIDFLGLWDCCIEELHLIVEYLGAMSIYLFNLHVLEHPWIKTYHEKKQQGESMSTADWIVSGVIEEFQPLLL